MKSFAGCRRGQIAIILTLTIPALVGAVAIATDIAILYSDCARAQQAADAAVLAGARYLPSNPSSAIRTARTCAAFNGVRPDEIVSANVGPDHLSITISISRSVPYLFSKVFGTANGKVGVVATARINSLGTRHRSVLARVTSNGRTPATASAARETSRSNANLNQIAALNRYSYL